MKKVVYLLPAVTVCSVYLLLMSIAGGPGSLQPIAWVYMLLPVIGTALLMKGNWWGGLMGMVMGLLMMYQNLTASGFLLPLGAVFAVYYAAMALSSYKCKGTSKNSFFALSGSFGPTFPYENLEIHKVFLRFP